LTHYLYPLLIHHSLTPTLFPYTTLFRSDVQKTIEFILERQAHAEVQMAAIREMQNRAEVEMADLRSGLARTDRLLRSAIQAGVRDRKSTRLNSSHQIISYAVFCLKKKTT